MKKLSASLLLLLASASQAGQLDTRLSYDGISKEYIQRVLISNTWQNGIGGSLEVQYNLTDTKYSGQADSLRVGLTELVFWYSYRPSDTFFIRPGLSTQANFGTTTAATIAAGTTGGSTSRPFVIVGKKWSDEWDSSVRYRYGHRNYDTKDLAGKLDNDDAHNLTIWTGYKVNSWLSLEYQLDYIRKVNNFVNDNKKKVIFENEFVAVFPDGFGKGVTPYFLIDHLGRSFSTEDKSAKTHWRPRVGLKIAF